MSKSGKKNFIFVAIIIILIGYIVFDKTSSKSADTAMDQNVTSDTVLQEENASSGEIKEEVVVKPKETEKSSLEICAEEKEKETESKGAKYTKGSALVSFLPDVTFDEAEKIVTNLKYSIENSKSAEDRFDDGQKWFVVNVPSGDEFEAICKLETLEEVKYAGINWVIEFGNE